jgi:hypothetical protein
MFALGRSALSGIPLRHGLLVVLALLFAEGALSAQAGQPSALQSHHPFTGSVPARETAPDGLSLSLKDAIERGLKQNLGVLLSRDATRDLEGLRRQDQSELAVSENSGDTFA